MPAVTEALALALATDPPLPSVAVAVPVKVPGFTVVETVNEVVVAEVINQIPL